MVPRTLYIAQPRRKAQRMDLYGTGGLGSTLYTPHSEADAQLSKMAAYMQSSETEGVYMPIGPLLGDDLQDAVVRYVTREYAIGRIGISCQDVHRVEQRPLAGGGYGKVS